MRVDNSNQKYKKRKVECLTKPKTLLPNNILIEHIQDLTSRVDKLEMSQTNPNPSQNLLRAVEKMEHRLKNVMRSRIIKDQELVLSTMNNIV